MIIFILPIAIAIGFLVLLVHDLVTDPSGHRPPPTSHYRDARFLPPSTRI